MLLTNSNLHLCCGLNIKPAEKLILSSNPNRFKIFLVEAVQISLQNKILIHISLKEILLLHLSLRDGCWCLEALFLLDIKLVGEVDRQV